LWWSDSTECLDWEKRSYLDRSQEALPAQFLYNPRLPPTTPRKLLSRRLYRRWINSSMETGFSLIRSLLPPQCRRGPYYFLNLSTLESGTGLMCMCHKCLTPGRALAKSDTDLLRQHGTAVRFE
jgi:hypothetical protein